MDIIQNNRRSFLKTGAVAGLASLVNPLTAFPDSHKSEKIKLKEGDVILFQGDSITDAGRQRDKTGNTNEALGNGYCLQAAAQLLLNHANKKLTIYNRGVSGNKVFEMAARWEEDCLQLKPAVLSILVGVNDFWHKHDGKYNGTIEKYKKDYVDLLTRTKDRLPDVQLIIGEPYAVSGVKAVDDSWFPEFNAYRAVAREVADQFGAVFIPYQHIFDEALKIAPGSYWTRDGVHAGLPGAALMAKAWLEKANIK
jgi:lysophospholipase L1-like esterase